MLKSIKNKKILIVVAHPDDEVLGLGATMNRLIDEFGVTVRVVILGDGITSRFDSPNGKQQEKDLKKHRENIYESQKIIGYQTVSLHNFPDNRFDSVALLDIIKIVEKEKDTFQPDLVFTHHAGDLNVDHQLSFKAVMTACRPLAEEKTEAIITFETPSSTEWQSSVGANNFCPNFYLEVSEENLAQKIKAMEAYEFERREYPHPRSPQALMALAQKRGVEAGKNLAEAFCIIKLIN
jgi:LmbE family N-acetylglucosaminyl deacetylase